MLQDFFLLFEKFLEVTGPRPAAIRRSMRASLAIPTRSRHGTRSQILYQAGPWRPTVSHRQPYFVAAGLAFLRKQHVHVARHAVPGIERGEEFPSPHLAFERSVKRG